MKVTKTNATSEKLSSEIDLFEDRDLPKTVKRRVAREVGEFLEDAILQEVGSAKSPLSGRGWPKLSKSYREFKQDNNLPGVANIEFTGQTLDQFRSRVSSDGKLEIGIFGDRAPVADGHNNFSGDSDLPLRRFIPGEGDRFKRNIQSEVDRIINEAVASRVRIDEERFSRISTKKSFFDELSSLFGPLSRAELTRVVLQDENLVSTFRNLNLLRFLDA